MAADLLKVEFDPKVSMQGQKVAIISGGGGGVNRCMLGLSG